MLLHCGCIQLQDIFLKLKGDLSKYDDAAKALTEYFQPSMNVPFTRHVFRNANQRDNETIEQFITRLIQKAETSEFTEVEEHIRDQIIEICSSNVLRQKFLKKRKELNLEMLREIKLQGRTKRQYLKYKILLSPKRSSKKKEKT